MRAPKRGDPADRVVRELNVHAKLLALSVDERRVAFATASRVTVADAATGAVLGELAREGTTALAFEGDAVLGCGREGAWRWPLAANAASGLGHPRLLASRDGTLVLASEEAVNVGAVKLPVRAACAAGLGYEQAKRDGRVRFVGVTGHQSARIIAKALDLYAWDNVLMPISAAERAHPESFVTECLHHVRYALSYPVSTVIVGCDTVEQLEENVRAAESYVPPSDAWRAELEARVRPLARRVLYYKPH